QIVDACAVLVGAQPRPLMISSFNPMVLLAVAERGLPHPVGLLTMSADLRGGIAVAQELGCGVICPHHSAAGLDAPGVRAAHDVGLAVLVWTVDQPDHATVLAHAGVDAICTNDPAGIHQVLQPLRR
ncbi:MAG TPA: glycerophosphodiester phosphodiesterase, partial [Euzebya sp.]|nr:glycerophosphodiester phosphodiesterase [Euzebya sp.]